MIKIRNFCDFHCLISILFRFSPLIFILFLFISIQTGRFIEWHQPLIGPSVLYWNIHSLLILFSLLSFNRDYFTIDCKQIYCDFNNLCLCQNYSQHYFDITCVNVPMDSFPNLTELSIRDQRYRHLYRVRIIGSKHLTRIEAGHFDNIMTLASLSITKTRLIHIDPQTFIMTPISSTLTSLDLSYGNLYEIPFEAIEPLNELRWLSLKGNQIESIQNSMIHSNKLQNDRNHHRSSQGIMTNRSISNNIGLKSLKTLLLNENQLVLIEDRSFRNFPSLELINFDHNMIERIEGDPFPSNLKSLYLSNCLLRKIPFESIQNLPLLELLQLKGNLINHLSPFKLSVRRIQLIDLSHNLITRIPEDLFANFNGQPTSFNFDTINTNTINRSRNGTKNNAREDGEQQNNSNSMDSTIYNFDFHYENGMNESATNHRSSIDWRLPSSSLRIDQLYLDFNFIQSLPNGVFRGVLIHKLSISNNRLTSSQIDPETFQGPTEFGLKVLDFNYNLIDGYPIALKSLRSLQRLSLRNNRIDRIDSDAFERCTSTLENLDLSQNLFEEIPSKALNRLKNLIKLNMHDNVIQSVNKNSLEGWCRKLKSLTLSKNGLVHLDPDAFHQCNQLSELRLGGNKFLHLQANLFDANNLSKLQLLDLSSLRKVDWIEQSGNNRHHANHFDEENKYNSNGNKRSKNQLNLIANNQSEESLYEKNILSQLKWLQFDFNRIEKIPPEMIRLFPRIKHLDLQNNLIKTIENDDFKGLNNLTSIILSNNNIRVLRTSSFENLKQLESLTLHFNRIKTIQTHSFNRLPRLQSLVLSKNQINYLWPDSFYNLSTQSRSLTLMLDDNRIQCFSVDCLRNIFLRNNLEKAHPQQNRSTQFVQDFSLYLNISHNRIKTFENCSNYWTFSQRRNRKNFEHTFNQHHHHHRHQQSSRSRIEISVLDLSHNQIENFQREFFDEFCSNTLSLLINNNLIRSLPLKLFIQCKRLQTLSLNYNLIQNVRNDLDFISDETNTNDDDMIGLNKSNSNDRDRIIKHFSIQSLSLHHNSIVNLQGFAEIFDRSLRLKILNLDHNKIESLPFDIFHRTSLISLSISSNLLESLDSSGDLNDKCFGISGSLKYLDLSKNLLSSLPKRILHCQNLIELILSENRIYLIDTILMRPLSRLLINLQRLELNQNPIDFNHFDRKIRADFDFLNNNSMLLVLNLNHLNLVRLQELNLPYLHTLDLSWNNLNSIHNRIFSQTRNIRSLNLASNRLNEIPKNIWKYITRLQHLNLCDNPIDVLDSSSFAGLKFLRFLDIRGLNLQFIDSRIFIYQRCRLSNN